VAVLLTWLLKLPLLLRLPAVTTPQRHCLLLQPPTITITLLKHFQGVPAAFVTCMWSLRLRLRLVRVLVSASVPVAATAAAGVWAAAALPVLLLPVLLPLLLLLFLLLLLLFVFLHK
jgi:hypothetical protein